ncbi:MAG: hypothetical protein ACREBN_00280, partial [Burkholderiaceae bacterium]
MKANFLSSVFCGLCALILTACASPGDSEERPVYRSNSASTGSRLPAKDSTANVSTMSPEQMREVRSQNT